MAVAEKLIAETNAPLAAKNKSRPRSLWAALALFAAVNAALATVSHVYQPPIEQAVTEAGAERGARSKPWSWWLARRYLEQKKAPDVVLFGSSQMGSAMCAADAQFLYKPVDALTDRYAATLQHDLQTRTGKDLSIFSLASPGAMCSDAFMASKALFKPGLQPKIVVLGVSPRDFIDNSMPYPATTEPFKFYSQYISPGRLTLCSYLDPMSWLQFGMDSLPTRKLGAFIQSKVMNNSQEQQQPDTTKTALAAVLGGGIALPGMWRVPANIPALWVDNTKEYKHRFANANPPVYQAEKAFFKEFLQDMHNRGIKVIVVGMPSLPMNRSLLSDKFWTEFRNNLDSACAANGASFRDLSADPDFVKDDYLDTVHLNARGGAKFFEKLAKFIAP